MCIHMRAHVKVEKVTAQFRTSVVSFSRSVAGRHPGSRSKFCDLLAFSLKWSIPRISGPIGLRPLLLSVQICNYIWHVTSIISFIFLPALAFAHPTDFAQTHRGCGAPPFSYLCLQEMWATQHSIKTIFCTIDPTTLLSRVFLFFPLPLSSSPGPSRWKSVFLALLLLKPWSKCYKMAKFYEERRGRKTLTIPGDEINKPPARSGIIRTQIPIRCVCSWGTEGIMPACAHLLALSAPGREAPVGATLSSF